jgi:CBS domain-containing protein
MSEDIAKPTELPGGRTAGDVMIPSPRTCSKFSCVIEAVLILKEEDCGLVPIVEEGKPIGVVTDRDVALALATFDDLVNHPIADIMTTKLVSVPTTAPLTQVVDMFGIEGVRRLLVVDAEGLLVGVIGWKDVCAEMPHATIGRIVTDIVETPTRK